MKKSPTINELQQNINTTNKWGYPLRFQGVLPQLLHRLPSLRMADQFMGWHFFHPVLGCKQRM
jgi:hypothetical protein